MSNLTVIDPKSLITQADLSILKKSKFIGFTDVEIAYCVKIINLLNLSPFLNQIHFVKRNNKEIGSSITTQIGIDGFRLTAQRAGGYAGSDEPIFGYDDGDTKMQVPTKATVVVYRMVKNMKCSFSASARWDEYYPKGEKNRWMWEKMPHNQLAKCAEALALRKAFPAELSSIYCEDEMHQADVGVYPEQPSELDGCKTIVVKPEYRIPNGTYAKRGFHEIDEKELKEYIERREQLIAKKPEKKPEWWDGFIERAEEYFAQQENEAFNPTFDGADSDF